MKLKIFFPLYFFCAMLLTQSFFIPIMNTQILDINENLPPQKIFNYTLDQAEVYVSIIHIDGGITNINKKISIENALTLSNELIYTNETVYSFEESFEQKQGVLKKFNIMVDEIPIEGIIFDSRVAKSNISNNISKGLLFRDKPIFNIFGIVSFVGLGVGFGFGINSHVPIIGYENIGYFRLLGGVTMWGIPMFIPQYLVGRISGVFTIFGGILVRVLYPYVYAPFIFGLGLCGPAIWWKRGIF